ncbi:hypothetical protein D3C84_400860 [compost metagenome]
MNGLRQFTLAGAGFAENEDIGVGSGDLTRGLQDRHHRRVVRIEILLAVAHLAFQRFQARGHVAHFQLLGRRHAQLLGAAGFDQVIRRPGLDGVDRGIHRRQGGDYHHVHPGRLHAHLRQYVEAVVLAQAQVEEAQVEHLALQQRFGLTGTAGRGHLMAGVLQAVTEGTQDRRLVIDQQDAPARLCCVHVHLQRLTIRISPSDFVQVA